MPNMIMQEPGHRLAEIMSVPQRRTARAKTQIEALTELTSPFCVRTEKKRQNPSPRRRRKCVKFFQSPVLSQAPHPLSNKELRTPWFACTASKFRQSSSAALQLACGLAEKPLHLLLVLSIKKKNPLTLSYSDASGGGRPLLVAVE